MEVVAIAGSYDLAIIGGGPGGYAAALYAAAAGLSVAVVEEDKVGGTCLHRGCVPAKELLETAAVYRTVASAADFGILAAVEKLDFSQSQRRKQAVVDQLHRGLTGLMRKRGIEIISSHGRLDAKRRVVLSDGSVLDASNVILAAGSVPRSIPGFEIDGEVVLTSDEVLSLGEIPQSVAVIGGGAIGCEFASMFADLGSKVTLVEVMPRLLPGCDGEVSDVLARSFRRRGMEVVLGTGVEGHTPSGSGTTIRLTSGREVEVEKVVISVGRRPRSEGLVDPASGVRVDSKGFVEVDAYMRTGVPGVWAIGDLVGTPALAHVGFAEAIVAVRDMLKEPVVPVDYGKVPWCIYCRPEVAFSGMTEDQAREAGFEVVVAKDGLGGNSRARILGETEGMLKLIAEKPGPGRSGRVLGVHLVGPWATELLGQGYLAVNWEATPAEIAQFIQPHPTLSETFGEVALALSGRGLHIG